MTNITAGLPKAYANDSNICLSAPIASCILKTEIWYRYVSEGAIERRMLAMVLLKEELATMLL